jgi:PAS domain S-box-containing protein
LVVVAWVFAAEFAVHTAIEVLMLPVPLWVHGLINGLVVAALLGPSLAWFFARSPRAELPRGTTAFGRSPHRRVRAVLVGALVLCGGVLLFALSFQLDDAGTEQARAGNEATLALMATVVVLIATLVALVVEPVVQLLRRQHGAMVAHSEELARLATVAERTTNAVVMTDADRRAVWVNEGFVRLTGYRPEDVLGRSPGAVLQCEKTDQATVRAMRAALSAGRPFRGEILNRGRDGREYWLDLDVQPVRNADGAITGFLAIESDITALVLARQELQTIFAAVAEGIVVQDVSGAITACNAAAEEILGLTKDQLTGRSSMDPRWQAIREDGSPLPGDEHPAMVTLRTGRASRGTVFGVSTPDQDRRWIRVSTEPLRDATGNVTGVVSSFADITAQRDSEIRMQLVVDGAGLGSWDWHVPSGRVVFNEHWSRMLGYEPGEIEPHVRSWERLVHPDDRGRALQVLTDHLEGRTAEYRCEHRLLRKDGTWCWVLDRGAVSERDVDGRPLRATGVHVDITAQKEIEERLMAAQRDADAANRSKTEFLANMSHEIRTPMTAILGFTDLLGSDGDVDSAPRRRLEYIDTIRRNGEHLLAIINDILDLSKIEAGKMTVERAATEPHRILHDVLSLMDVKARAKGLDLRAVFDTAIPEWIESDPLRLRQILVNLVGNAIKFTEVGGVVVHVSYERGTDDRDGRLHFDVVDTGIGMTKAESDRLFAAFVQADTSTTRRFGGTGLGLSISKRLAVMLGGDISVASEPGRGSTFRLSIATGSTAGFAWLPAGTPAVVASAVPVRSGVQSEDARAASNEHHAAKPLDGVRILLAEDGPDNLRLISYHLRTAGADVRTVVNGRQAVELLTTDGTLDGPLLEPPPVDLVLTDMQMPEMDGYAATRLLRAKGLALPIVALTAHAMAGDMEKCIEAGCDDYANKPIDRVKLIDVCRRLAA